MSWRYIATRLNGDGSESIIDTDLPLSDVSLTTALSGTDGLQAKITPEVARLKGDDGLPIILPWSTAIYAEADGLIRHGTIVKDLNPSNAELEIIGTGFTGYLKDIPYMDVLSELTPDPLGIAPGVRVDPLNIVRHIWGHAQGQTAGNLGLALDSTTSPIRIGTESTDVEFTTGSGEDVSFEAGPYVLAWYKTDDLGAEFDKLSEATPFDYWVEHEWSGDTIVHRLRLAYPNGGRRRNDLRFVVGENFTEVPDVDYFGEDYASEALVLGSGEGRKMMRGRASRTTGRLRRVAVVADKALSSKSATDAAASREIAYRLGDVAVSEIVIRDHPHAPAGSYSVGDDIYLQGDIGWGEDLDLWVRVVSLTITPGSANEAHCSVIRTDKIGA